jgi:hypothetical protein
VAKLSLSRAWDETRDILSRDGKLIGAVALALVVLPQTVLGLFAPQEGEEIARGAMWVLAISLIIGLVSQVALNRLAIGPSTTVGQAIMTALKRTPSLLVAFIVLLFALVFVTILLAMLLGALGVMAAPGTGQQLPPAMVLLLVVLTAAGYAIFQLAAPVAAAEPGGPIATISRSWRLSKGNYFRLLAFAILLLICMIVALLAAQFLFGSAFTVMLGEPTRFSLSALAQSLTTALVQSALTVLFAVMLARIYVQLSGPGHADVSVPNSGT